MNLLENALDHRDFQLAVEALVERGSLHVDWGTFLDLKSQRAQSDDRFHAAADYDHAIKINPTLRKSLEKRLAEIRLRIGK